MDVKSPVKKQFGQRIDPSRLTIFSECAAFRAHIAEVMTNMDVKKQFGQRLFSVFNYAAKVALLVLRLQHLHLQLC